MSISAQADFIGDVNLTQITGTLATDLVAMITQVEKKYLRLLLGDDLYVLFIAGIAAETEIYETLLEGEEYENGGSTWVYEGLEKMLLYFIYAEWKIVRLSEDTSMGTVRQNKDKSNKLEMYHVEKISNDAFNKAVDLYHAAYNYLLINITDFETWVYTDIKKRSHFGVIRSA